MKPTFTCRDCHQVKPIFTSGLTTGYARLRDGHKVCYSCCAARDTRYMIRKGQHDGLYLTGTPTTRMGFWRGEVTNWPGTLRFHVFHFRNGKHPCWGGYARRQDAWFNGPDGYVWHAVVRGDMTLARCKRTTQRWQQD